MLVEDLRPLGEITHVWMVSQADIDTVTSAGANQSSDEKDKRITSSPGCCAESRDQLEIRCTISVTQCDSILNICLGR